jgi:iron complex outermembrane receptor protein
MNINYKSFIKTTVAISSLCVSAHAFAADATADQAAVPYAGDIIVSARRVEERLQDVPITITVVSQDRLDAANISSSLDLIKVVPGLAVQARYSPENSSFSIRGFSQELRTTSSVGTYFGEVVAPRGGGISLPGGDGAGPGSLFDLQNIQVLKGPQGTLFGRNTTGGAVLLSPRKPTGKFEGYVEGSYGNYNMFRLQGVVNVPLASWARLRLGVDQMSRDGYLHNASPVGPRDFANVDYVTTRASLVLDVAPNIENYTIASFSRSDNNGTPGQIYRAHAGVGLGNQVTPQVNRLNASGDPYQIEQKDAQARSLTKQWQIINTTTLLASDDITLKNIASYSQIRQILRQDIFSSYIPYPLAGRTLGGLTFPSDAMIATPYAFSGDKGYTNAQNNFTEEVQLQGNGLDGKLNFQAGLYYEHSTPGAPTESLSPGVGSVCSSAGFERMADIRCLPTSVFAPVSTFNYSNSTLEFINMAAYTQATYAVTDQIKLTGGVRLTYDRTRGTATAVKYTFTNTGGPAQYGTPVFNGCQSDFATYANCTVGSDVLRTSSTKPTWTASATYKPFDAALFYATYSRGYRQGSTTPLSLTYSTSFNPESVDSYDIGVKTSFRGAVSGYFNVSGFYSALKNQQLLVGLQDAFGNSGTTVVNAGKSRMYGVDADAMLKFGDIFRVNASMTYLNTKVISLDPGLIQRFRDDGWVAIAPSALAGDVLPYSPKWSVNFNPIVTLPVPAGIGTIELGASYRFTSAYTTSSAASNPNSNVKATAVKQLDLNLDWKNIGGSPVDFSLFATNVTNQFTVTTVQPLYDSFGFDMRYLGPPRMYGMRLRVRFGEGISN